MGAMTRPGKSSCLCNTGFRGDGFACKSADAPAGTVAGFKASLTLNMDYAFVSTNRAKFDKAFSKDVADSRGLPEAAVTVSTVSAGSVVVDFAVKGTETCKPGSMTISPTELSLLCPSCPPVTVSAMKCTGVVMTVPEPEGPLQVFRVTHYLDTSCDVKTEYKSHVAVDMAAALSIRKQAIVVHNVTTQVSNKVAVVCTITGGFVNVKAIKDKLKGTGYPSLARVCSTPVVPATTAIVAENDPAAKPNQRLAKNGDCHDKATCAWLAQDGNFRCEVVDKCLEGTHMCDANANCKFTGPGKHTCTCKKHFTGKNGTVCTAVDNCKLGKNVSKCGEDAECVYTTPGFNNCTCRTGFFGDGPVCTRENPCTLANGGCSANGKCAMTRPGKSSCLCNTGFRGDGFACKSADAPAGTVAGFKASLTLNMDYAFVSTNRAKFDKAFSKDVADSRGLPEAAVTVSTVSAGSVVVDFAVKGTETCKPGSMTISPTELS